MTDRAEILAVFDGFAEVLAQYRDRFDTEEAQAQADTYVRAAERLRDRMAVVLEES